MLHELTIQVLDSFRHEKLGAFFEFSLGRGFRKPGSGPLADDSQHPPLL